MPGTHDQKVRVTAFGLAAALAAAGAPATANAVAAATPASVFAFSEGRVMCCWFLLFGVVELVGLSVGRGLPVVALRARACPSRAVSRGAVPTPPAGRGPPAGGRGSARRGTPAPAR